MSNEIACIKYSTLVEELEVEEKKLDTILNSLRSQGFVTTVKLEGELNYCLTEEGQEYTQDWFRHLDLEVESVTLEHLVEMLESTAPPDRQD